MLTPIAQKWLKVLVFILTTEDSTLSTEACRTGRTRGTSRPGQDAVKAFFWIMVAILVALLTAHL